MTRPGDTYHPKMGDYLGDLSDELKGGEILEFVAGGPKQYGYIYQDKNGQQKTELKICGFCLDRLAKESINYERVREMVEHFVKTGAQDTETIGFRQIATLKDRTVVTRWAKKTYKVVYKKRCVLPDFTTVPYGY